ncbi:nuclear transport factor 2 family protein [Ensifer adhaerens]|uniref:nuclear transport factor 2 family protein n=1 Tax=Ensifer adhaerens TaxID=106592 RepID=UPI000FDB18D8|nr:nuclear transport factor 2 family protein [Ensifer adhaerens]MDF8357660.1 nuclear transport factor 2 family protein [Ensifer adhaerens]THA60195.1 nuclear transport factor 2 family protein [Ensifer adhaerens]
MTGSAPHGAGSIEADIDRKAIALEYLKRLDRGGDFFELFDEHIQFFFPKIGIVNGLDAVKAAFGKIASLLAGITHDYAYFNYVVNGDTVVVEGTSAGTTADGVEFRAGVTHAGRWCDVFEIRDGRIQRLFVYLDPDYAGKDTGRYPWMASTES